MKHVSIVNIAFWVVVAIALAIAGVGAVGYYRVTDALRRQVQAQAAEIVKQKQNLLEITRRINRVNASGAVVVMTLRDLNSVAVDTSKACGHPEQIQKEIRTIADEIDAKSSAESSRFLNIVSSLCQNGNTPQGEAFTKFLIPYGEAVNARLNEDYGAALTNYNKAIATMELEPEWRMRAEEGLAYASMQRGDYDSARKAISASLRETDATGFGVGHNYVFARLTQMKLRCRLQAPAREVQQEFRSLISDLSQLAESRDSMAKLYYSLDLSYAKGDQELFDTCQYAHLDPRKAA